MEFQKVQEMISKMTGIEPGMIAPERNLFADLGMDDCSVFELVLELERHFEVVIRRENMADWETVEDVWQTVKGG